MEQHATARVDGNDVVTGKGHSPQKWKNSAALSGRTNMTRQLVELGLLGTVLLALLLLAGLTLPILMLLAVSYGIDGRFLPMAACVIGFFGVFYVFEVLKERLKSTWNNSAQSGGPPDTTAEKE